MNSLVDGVNRVLTPVIVDGTIDYYASRRYDPLAEHGDINDHLRHSLDTQRNTMALDFAAHMSGKTQQLHALRHAYRAATDFARSDPHLFDKGLSFALTVSAQRYGLPFVVDSHLVVPRAVDYVNGSFSGRGMLFSMDRQKNPYNYLATNPDPNWTVGVEYAGINTVAPSSAYLLSSTATDAQAQGLSVTFSFMKSFLAGAGAGSYEESSQSQARRGRFVISTSERAVTNGQFVFQGIGNRINVFPLHKSMTEYNMSGFPSCRSSLRNYSSSTTLESMSGPVFTLRRTSAMDATQDVAALRRLGLSNPHVLHVATSNFDVNRLQTETSLRVPQLRQRAAEAVLRRDQANTTGSLRPMRSRFWSRDCSSEQQRHPRHPSLSLPPGATLAERVTGVAGARS